MTGPVTRAQATQDGLQQKPPSATKTPASKRPLRAPPPVPSPSSGTDGDLTSRNEMAQKCFTEFEGAHKLLSGQLDELKKLVKPNPSPKAKAAQDKIKHMVVSTTLTIKSFETTMQQLRQVPGLQSQKELNRLLWESDSNFEWLEKVLNTPAMVEERAQIISLESLQIRLRQFDDVLARFKAYRIRVEGLNTDLIAQKTIRNETDIAKVDLILLNDLLYKEKGFVPTHAALLIEAKEFIKTIPRAVFLLTNLIQGWKDTYISKTNPIDGKFFDQSSALSKKSPSKLIENHKEMSKLIPQFERILVDLNEQWTSLDTIWDRAKDDVRYFGCMEKFKRIPIKGWLSANDEWKGNNKIVDTFHWYTMDYHLQAADPGIYAKFTEFFTKLWKSTPATPDAAAPASSTTS